jgi:cytochrome c553
MFTTRVCSLAVGTLIIGPCVGVSVALADDSKLKAYGAHLARECTACHRLDGTDNGIPSIVGWESERFAATLKFYQQGLRKNAAMVSVAQSLDEEQLQALAAYFSSLAPPAKKPSSPRAKNR